MSPEQQRRSNGEFPDAPRADYRPRGVATKSSTFATVKRTFTEFSEDGMTDWAAALTYYGLLSPFPALIALVSILGLFGNPQSTTNTITQMVSQLGPSRPRRRSPAR